MISVYEISPVRNRPGRALFEAANVIYDRVFWKSAFDGTSPGRLFVDHPTSPTSAVLARTYDYFLAGQASPALIQFLKDAPPDAHPLDRFYGYVPLTREWLQAMLEAFPTLVREDRRSFRFGEKGERAARTWMSRVPKGIRVVPLDPALARAADAAVGDEIEILLGSYDLFARQYYGYAAVDEATGNVLSVAYTAGVTEREVNLGVGTVESARRRGLAKLLCQACCEAANRAGQIVTWDCDRVNTASGALAESLGFIEESSFVELAFPDPVKGMPHRVTPEPTGVSWTARENPIGVISWTRDSTTDTES
jgi:GNAT superfamily N-acetyltransferase